MLKLLFEVHVEIQNLVCGYILGSRSVAYCFKVTLTLASGLGFRKNYLMLNNFPQMSCIRHVTVTNTVCNRL